MSKLQFMVTDMYMYQLAVDRAWFSKSVSDALIGSTFYNKHPQVQPRDWFRVKPCTRNALDQSQPVYYNCCNSSFLVHYIYTIIILNGHLGLRGLPCFHIEWCPHSADLMRPGVNFRMLWGTRGIHQGPFVMSQSKCERTVTWPNYTTITVIPDD